MSQTVDGPFDVVLLFVVIRLGTTMLNLLAIDVLHLRFGLGGAGAASTLAPEAKTQKEGCLCILGKR